MRSLPCLIKLNAFQPLILAVLLCCIGTIAHPREAIPISRDAIAQTEDPETPEAESDEPPVQRLQPGDQGEAVIALQEKLQTLGYFEGELDGDYGIKTKTAVAKFQSSQNLSMDGIAGPVTLQQLDEAIAQQEASENETEETEATETEATDTPPSNRRFLLLGGAIATFILASLGLIVLLSLFSKAMQPSQLPPEDNDDEPPPEPLALPESPPAPKDSFPEEEDDEEEDLTEPWFTENPPVPSKFVPEPPTNAIPQTNNASLATEVSPSENHHIEPSQAPEAAESEFSVISSPPPSPSHLALPADKALPKIDPIEELIQDLQAPQPDKRRQAIWELAQHADSRAVQPLIGLLIDSDSQQRGLILEALAQIGSRTLKPMNRALTIALQDENAQVRKNAIRDLTQMYELIAKLSKLLYLAIDDPDPEVQETAKWALNQLNNIKIPNFGDKES